MWQQAQSLALELYRATAGFPAVERYGLSLQLRRAAVSVASNIAEGSGRAGDRECARFLRVARGSASEIECQLMLARDLGYLPESIWAELNDSTQRINRMLLGLVRSLDTRRRPQGVRP
ncbi:MAG: four helix bundle protein [Gemmatimonadales bacterium]